MISKILGKILFLGVTLSCLYLFGSGIFQSNPMNLFFGSLIILNMAFIVCFAKLEDHIKVLNLQVSKNLIILSALCTALGGEAEEDEENILVEEEQEPKIFN